MNSIENSDLIFGNHLVLKENAVLELPVAVGGLILLSKLTLQKIALAGKWRTVSSFSSSCSQVITKEIPSNFES